MATLALLTAGLLAATAITAPAGRVPAHVDNPYAGAVGYRNPQWSARAAAEPGGSRVAGTPTAVWLDSIAAIEGDAGEMGLRAHLDEALAQGADLVPLVLHNLPGRDCDRLYSEGELAPAELARYRAEFIDPIAAVLADDRYAGLRIITTIEPGALPNLVLSTTPQPTATFRCDLVRANGSYVLGIRYALDRLSPIPNVYTYLDAGNHAQSAEPVAPLLFDTVRGTAAGPARLDGFSLNTADYAPLREPFITVDDQTRQSRWIHGSRYNEELPFALDLRDRLIGLGFPSGIGMLIDTSRNGWGGAARPAGPSSEAEVDVRVDQSRVDRRAHKRNWCNQAGAGLGERPRAAPEPGIDAYVWQQPPGVSDGTGLPLSSRAFNPMCDPTYGGGVANDFHPTTALPGSPDRGEWFSAQFRELLANAYPPLPPLQPAGYR
jgi:cellulose 1,4-beta-cellobiosidase